MDAKAAIEEYTATLSDTHKRMYLKVKRGEGNRNDAIRLFCLECMGWNQSEPKRCTAPQCPLFDFRTGRRDAPAL